MYQIIEDYLGFLPQEFEFIVPIIFMTLIVVTFYVMFIFLGGKK